MTADSDVFYAFVFDGQDYPPERVEQAARAVQRQLDSGELRRVNDALLARLAEAKKARPESIEEETAGRSRHQHAGQYAGAG